VSWHKLIAKKRDGDPINSNNESSLFWWHAIFISDKGRHHSLHKIFTAANTQCCWSHSTKDVETDNVSREPWMMMDVVFTRCSQHEKNIIMLQVPSILTLEVDTGWGGSTNTNQSWTRCHGSGHKHMVPLQTENNLLRRAPHSVLEYHIRFGVLSENSISDSDKHQKGPILILNSFHWCHHASYTCVFVAIVVCTNVENNVDVHAMWRHLHKGAWRTGRIFWTMYFPAVRFLFKPFIRQGYALNREGFPL
jgi:hypothetical protein